MSSLFCRARKRKVLSILVAFIAIAVTVTIIITSNSLNGAFIWSLSMNEYCRPGYSDSFLTSLCKNYTENHVFGNLCSSICNGSKFTRNGCIKHSTSIVISGKLNGDEVVLKMKKQNWPGKMSIGALKDILGNGDLQQKQEIWKETAYNRLENSIGKIPNYYKSERKIILQNLKAPLTMDVKELLAFLSLLQNEEYATLGTYQELRHFPKIYGYCGQTYVMEKLNPYTNFFPAIIQKFDWKRTAKIALSFLDVIDELETAKGGPLEHCDIQEGNFGVSKDYEIKPIDVDLILTKDRSNLFLHQPSCTKDSDCEFFDCISKCDMRKKRCLAKRATSNLQVLCRDIFKSTFPSTGLFGRMPSSVRHFLEPLLNECASLNFGSYPYTHKKVSTMVQDIRHILLESLKKS